MFAKVQTLDSYSKQIIAPLGIYFPFPLHCSKLDSYLRRSVLNYIIAAVLKMVYFHSIMNGVSLHTLTYQGGRIERTWC